MVAATCYNLVSREQFPLKVYLRGLLVQGQSYLVFDWFIVYLVSETCRANKTH